MKPMKSSLVLILLLSLILLGCSIETGAFNSTKFINELSNLNLNFTVIDNDEKDPFFSVIPKGLDVNGEYIVIFEYPTKEEMEREASNIREDGNMKNASISYTSVPHFFKKGNIIVRYVGENQEIIKSLEQVMGRQFAGR
jgi:hypothetical protein